MKSFIGFHFPHNIDAETALNQLIRAEFDNTRLYNRYLIQAVDYLRRESHIVRTVHSQLREDAMLYVVFAGFVPYETTLFRLLELKNVHITLLLYENTQIPNENFRSRINKLGWANRYDCIKPSSLMKKNANYGNKIISDKMIEDLNYYYEDSLCACIRHYRTKFLTINNGTNIPEDADRILDVVGEWYSRSERPVITNDDFKEKQERYYWLLEYRNGSHLDATTHPNTRISAMIQDMLTQIDNGIRIIRVPDSRNMLSNDYFSIRTTTVETKYMMDVVRRLSYVYDYGIVQSRIADPAGDYYVTMAYAKPKEAKILESLRKALRVGVYHRETNGVEVYLTDHLINTIVA